MKPEINAIPSEEDTGKHSPIRNRKQKSFTELQQLERLADRGSKWFELKKQAEVRYKNQLLPIYSLQNIKFQKNAPLLFLVGGIHGVERIGSQSLLAFLSHLIERLHWDDYLNQLISKTQIVAIPVANPSGMALGKRSNANGVDLMRNSPIESFETKNLFVSGQSISSLLPWYRGSNQLEVETATIDKVLGQAARETNFILSLDLHSGFGFRDRIWFPYAYRSRLMKRISPIVSLKLLWERSYPDNAYIIEPQSNHYLTHGDLWDYFYKKYGHKSGRTFIPLTLEMGSWIWLKKRPIQALRFDGYFNPNTKHRKSRVLRRHISLMNFLLHASINYQNWLPTPEQEDNLSQFAHTLWKKT